MFLYGLSVYDFEPSQYENKCPKESGNFQDNSYSSLGKFPLTMKQIYEENGVYDIMSQMGWFDENLFNNNQNQIPQLWTKN